MIEKTDVYIAGRDARTDFEYETNVLKHERYEDRFAEKHLRYWRNNRDSLKDILEKVLQIEIDMIHTISVCDLARRDFRYDQFSTLADKKLIINDVMVLPWEIKTPNNMKKYIELKEPYYKKSWFEYHKDLYGTYPLITIVDNYLDYVENKIKGIYHLSHRQLEDCNEILDKYWIPKQQKYKKVMMLKADRTYLEIINKNKSSEVSFWV